jgi:hypothetical protein
MFAGTVSLNPYLAIAQIFLILAWKVAGRIGVDGYMLPFLRRGGSAAGALRKQRR